MKKTLLILCAIFLIGLILRTLNLHDNIFFGYDQARDGARIYDIVNLRKFKLVGPESDIPGVFNGPLFYYLLLPINFIFNFNPNYAALFLIVLNLSATFFLYLSAKALFDNKKVGYLSAFLWTISYQSANFAKFISNASIIPLVSLMFFSGLIFYFIKRKNSGLIISVIGLGLAVQMDFYLIYLVIFYFIGFILFNPRINYKNLLIAIAVFILLTSSFFIAEIRFQFMSSKSMLTYFQSQSVPSNVTENLSIYIQSMVTSLSYSIFSFNMFFMLLIFVSLSIYLIKTEKNKKSLKFVFIWLFSTLPLFAFKTNLVFGSIVQSSTFGAASLFFALALYRLFSSRKTKLIAILFAVIIICSNLKLFIQDDFMNNKILGYQSMTYADEKQLIDYTYKSVAGNKFSICAISNPLFINTLWSYLYRIYGQPKYGYLPYWSGQKQYLNETFLPYDTNHVTNRYLIIEPMAGINDFARRATIFAEDQISTVVEEKKFGDIIIQRRKMLTDKSQYEDTQNISPEEIIKLKELISTTDPRYSCYINY